MKKILGTSLLLFGMAAFGQSKEDSIQFRTISTEILNNGKGYTVKYYKGLGTSGAKEAKEYFREFKTMDFFLKETCFNSIDMAFNPKRADDRKTWILSHNVNNLLDYNDKTLSYTDFINKELILFSIYDNERSIPSLFDGLKPSQRKVLYTFNKKNIVSSIKVSQVVGIISSKLS